MDELGINRGFSPHFSPSRNLSLTENQQQLYIHLPNHGFRIIRIDEVPDVRTIVNNLVGSMSSSSGAKPNPQFYALRLRHIISKEILWLPLSKFIKCRYQFPLNNNCKKSFFISRFQQLQLVKSSTTSRMNHAPILDVQTSPKHHQQ